MGRSDEGVRKGVVHIYDEFDSGPTLRLGYDFAVSGAVLGLLKTLESMGTGYDRRGRLGGLEGPPSCEGIC
jgi:hypothetical protein